jgi:DnaJ-domain-containing protein 1
MYRKPEPAAASSWGGRGSLDPFGVPPSGPRSNPAGAAAGPRPRPRPSAGAAARESTQAARPARRPERPEAARPSAPAGERGIERPFERGRPARLQAVEDLLRRTEDLVRLAQQADVGREHRGRLMEWEAELAAIHRRLADPSVELGPIHGRLTAIDTELRQLKFSRRAAAAAKGKPAAETVPNWYEVLRVPETASDAEIRASYHQLLKQYHPDLHNDSGFPWVKEQAHQITRQIGAAYQALGSAEKRQSYDRELRRRRGGGP